MTDTKTIAPTGTEAGFDLDKLEALLNAATPEDWSIGETYTDQYDDGPGAPETVIRGLGGEAGIAVTIDFGSNNPTWREANAAFIVAAKNSMPALIALARRAAPTCPTCKGNDGDMPCAYPSKGMTGCLRDARRAAPDSAAQQSSQNPHHDYLAPYLQAGFDGGEIDPTTRGKALAAYAEGIKARAAQPDTTGSASGEWTICPDCRGYGLADNGDCEMCVDGKIPPSAPAPSQATTASASIDSDPEFQRLAEYWRGEPYGTRAFENAWAELVAHIDSRPAQPAQAGEAVDELPPLPESRRFVNGYGAHDMQEYARSAVAKARASLAPVSAQPDQVAQVARAMAKHAGWDQWDTAQHVGHTLSGNEPEEERQHWCELAEIALSVSAQQGAAVAPVGNEGIWSWERRAEAATMFLRNYADTNMEVLLDGYHVQPIIRRLAAAIKEWQEDVIREAPAGMVGIGIPVGAAKAPAAQADTNSEDKE